MFYDVINEEDRGDSFMRVTFDVYSVGPIPVTRSYVDTDSDSQVDAITRHIRETILHDPDVVVEEKIE
jgi:hypothetical protein